MPLVPEPGWSCPIAKLGLLSTVAARFNSLRSSQMRSRASSGSHGSRQRGERPGWLGHARSYRRMLESPSKASERYELRLTTLKSPRGYARELLVPHGPGRIGTRLSDRRGKHETAGLRNARVAQASECCLSLSSRDAGGGSIAAASHPRLVDLRGVRAGGCRDGAHLDKGAGAEHRRLGEAATT
jgi:hypothetical protein